MARKIPSFSLNATSASSGRTISVASWNEGPPTKDEIAGFTTAGRHMIQPPSNACSVRLLPKSRRAWAEGEDGLERKMTVDRVKCSEERMRRLGGIVLATPSWGPLAPKIRSFLPGEIVLMHWSYGWPGAMDVLPGNPTLVEDGVNVGYACPSPFCARNPRTGVGLDAEGRVLLVTVDGRRPGYSVGMSILEFARQFKRLGAKWALNLDGGGSTTMWVKGRVINRPTDPYGERSVSSALLVLRGDDPGEGEPLSYGALAFGTPMGAGSTTSPTFAPSMAPEVESPAPGRDAGGQRSGLHGRVAGRDRCGPYRALGTAFARLAADRGRLRGPRRATVRRKTDRYPEEEVLAGSDDVFGELDLHAALLTQLAGAVLADLAVLVVDQGGLGGTEDTHVLPLLKDHAVAIDADLELVSLMDPEDPAEL